MKDNNTIHTTVGEVLSTLQRLGIPPTRHVTITLDPLPDALDAARSACRPLVVAAGLSDADIDALIKDARRESAAEAQ